MSKRDGKGGWTWTWYPATDNPNPLSVFGMPDLLKGINEASGDTLKVCDYTHGRDFAIIKFNEERPTRLETDDDSTSGLSALEYFIEGALRGQGRITSQADAIFTRFWTEDVAF